MNRAGATIDGFKYKDDFLTSLSHKMVNFRYNLNNRINVPNGKPKFVFPIPHSSRN